MEPLLKIQYVADHLTAWADTHEKIARSLVDSQAEIHRNTAENYRNNAESLRQAIAELKRNK